MYKKIILGGSVKILEDNDEYIINVILKRNKNHLKINTTPLFIGKSDGLWHSKKIINKSNVRYEICCCNQLLLVIIF